MENTVDIMAGDYVKLKGDDRITQVMDVIHVKHWGAESVIDEHYEVRVKMKKSRLYPVEDIEWHARDKKELLKKKAEK